MKSSMVRDLTRQVKAAGLELVEITTHPNSHFKLRVMRPDDGETMTITTSATTSDWRAEKNRAARFKRFALHREHAGVPT